MTNAIEASLMWELTRIELHERLRRIEASIAELRFGLDGGPFDHEGPWVAELDQTELADVERRIEALETESAHIVDLMGPTSEVAA